MPRVVFGKVDGISYKGVPMVQFNGCILTIQETVTIDGETGEVQAIGSADHHIWIEVNEPHRIVGPRHKLPPKGCCNLLQRSGTGLTTLLGSGAVAMIEKVTPDSSALLGEEGGSC